MIVVLFIVSLALLLWDLKERFSDPQVTPPSETDRVLRSKIEVNIPIGGEPGPYVQVAKAFYDKVYLPASTNPKLTELESFLQSPDANVPGVEKEALRRILANVFKLDSGLTAQAKEEQQVKFQPSEALEPKMGVDEVFTRTEKEYQPVDSTTSIFASEGTYAPVPAINHPRNDGSVETASTSWKQGSFYNLQDENVS